MTKDEAQKFFGNQGRLAKAIGLAQPTVSDWEEIPDVRQWQIELGTRGKLKADRPPLNPLPPKKRKCKRCGKAS